VATSCPSGRFAVTSPLTWGGAQALADGGGGGGEPALGPLRHRGEHGLQRTTTRGQSIAHAHRWTGVDKPFHHAFGLELAKAFCQNAIADSGDSREQLIETRRSRKKSFDHRPGPALPYQLDRALKGRAVVEAPSDHGE
jgi:hypothetical protein